MVFTKTWAAKIRLSFGAIYSGRAHFWFQLIFFKVFYYINMKLIYKKWVYLRFMVLAPLEIDKLNSRLKKSLNWCLLVTFWRIIVGIRRNGIFSNVKHWSLHHIVLYWNVSNGNVKYGKKVHCGHEGIKLPVLVER